jgi:uncharacterized protein (UPF0276 family)
VAVGAAAAADAAVAEVAVVTDVPVRDRVGIGWRPDLAGGILAHLDRIDVVELIADDHFDATTGEARALRTLGAQVPVLLHGVSLGLASSHDVDWRRLDAMARLVDRVRPESWSEHLAFVRAGGREIGHLAAPPRTRATIEGAARNVAAARRVVGVAPLLENVATLIDPPGSEVDEPAWIGEIAEAVDAGLLLDLHNLHANAVNYGFDAHAALRRLPLGRVGAVHLAGGQWIGASPASRLLDDHRHDVPDAVFDLLADLASLACQPVTVIIERDGNFPPFEHVLTEVERARDTVARGRAAASVHAAVLA